ncbi:MAG: S9 family peptidase [Proteobacteria bacterium]|nr:MAG: S9 family peptidase [Pseudomonadota bacterium]
MFASRYLLLLTVLWIGACSQPEKPSSAAADSINVAVEDPFLWLEEIDTEQSLNWVKKHNKRSLAVIENQPKFQTLYEANKSILNADDRIAYVAQMGGHLYNFWRDAQHVRGIYRRTTLESYQSEQPHWEIILDVDALAEQENENWVYKGMTCRQPVYDRCLVNLSRGGADATVVREFDLHDKEFIADGFYLPEAKTGVSWVDQDRLLVGTHFGDGSITDSGYPKVVKLWQRGEPLDEAETIFSGNQTDVGVWPVTFYDGDDQYLMIRQSDSFYTGYQYILNSAHAPVKLDIPHDADVAGLIKGQLLINIKSDLDLTDRIYKQGSLVSTPLSALLEGHTDYQLIMAPSAQMAIADVSTSRDYVFVNTLDNVSSVLYKFKPQDDWSKQVIKMPELGSVSVTGTSQDNNDVFINYHNYLTPSTLYHYQADDEKLSVIKQLPEQFDAEPYQVEQHFMMAADGTRVPYFVVGPKDMVYDGSNPTLLYGYGGFEVSMRPRYLSIVGTDWLANGGVYVVANIRGGGEYGPAWHQAALKEKRMVAYHDFIGVAEDLIAKNITSPEHLGIYGGSNGGLLVGAVTMLRPDLFNAVVSAVPLLDMKRFNQLLAGASWMAEYGNPDIPEQWDYIKTYSPYHNLKANQDYPEIFFTTSTRDDRVHPGHARKMAALMEAYGHDFYYYENIEGGHGGASNNDQTAYLRALVYSYLLLKLQ